MSFVRSLPPIALACLLLLAADDGSAEEQKTPELLMGGDDSAVTSEVLDELVSRVARDANAEGIAAVEDGDFPSALSAFAEAYALAPNDAEVVNNLGFAYHQLGDRARAETLYRRALELEPGRVSALLNLSDLFLELDDPQRLEEAARLLLEARQQLGNRGDVILRQARVEVKLGRKQEAERFYMEVAQTLGTEEDGPDSDAVRLEIGDAYLELGQEELATRWYREVPRASTLYAVAQDRIRELEIAAEARRYGWLQKNRNVSPRARALTDRAEAFLHDGRFDQAQRKLNEALRLVPDFTDARRLLGDVHLARGDPAAAEADWLRALALDQGDVDVHARLGRLYLERPQRAPLAARLLSRAVQIDPRRRDLFLDLARAWQLTGDVARAREVVERYLEELPRQDPGRARALLLRQQLSRALPDDGAGTASVAAGPTDATDLDAVNRARAYLARGETGAALVELRRARAARGADETSTLLLNLEARILAAAGEPRRAVEAFTTSLSIDPTQAEVWTERALVREELGAFDAALMDLIESRRLGHAEAAYHRARLALRRGLARGGLVWPRDVQPIRDVLTDLEAFQASDPDSVYAPEARDLAAALSQALWRTVFVVVGGLVVLVLLVVVWATRRWGGATLGLLLARHPEVGPDVQRILSAVRHEVLKHNTMVLTGIVDAIERGEAVAEQVAHVRRNLFGEGEHEGVVVRLDAYAAQLDKLGRAHALRLNLQRRDPAFSALFEGFARLQRLLPRLGHVHRLGPRRHRRALERLRHVTRLLNTQAYEAVCGLLDDLRVLSVDRALLEGIYERTRREPGLVGANLTDVDLDIDIELPCGVSVPRPAFEDILGNLFRNAIQSSMRHSNGDPVAVGLRVDSEVNPITGHEKVRFAVCDRSPESLTVEMLRGRRIEGGLGLAAELVSRYDGAIDVEPGRDGWSKAVVVKLTREESPRAPQSALDSTGIRS